MLAQLPLSLSDLLQVALESHRYALGIDQDSPDLLLYALHYASNPVVKLMILSNTAQVLTSLVEAPIERRRSTDDPLQALRVVQEALELFKRCLTLQEFQITQARVGPASSTTHTEHDYDSGTVSGNGVGSGTISEEAWVSVEEQVTVDSLVDTILAQLETLTTLCTLTTSQGSVNLSWIEEYHRTASEKLSSLVQDTKRAREASLTNAKYMAAFADASFRYGQLNILEYERELNSAFNTTFDLSNDPQGLCDQAEAESLFSASVLASASSHFQSNDSNVARTSDICWKHLTKALDNLAAASKLPDAKHLTRIHLRRGDCELLRYRLSRGSNSHPMAAKSARTLIKNAEVYYRGASALARISGDEDEEREAFVKEAVVASLVGSGDRLEELSKTNRKAVFEVLDEMREEGLLCEDDTLIEDQNVMNSLSEA